MISILMSTHNPIDAYFEMCLESIYNQTYQDFEIVLVDDGSDSDVLKFIADHGYDIMKINYIRLEQNVGLPKALNIGLKECKGEFIARMDDDDVMDSTRLEKQLKVVQNNECVGCFSFYNLIDSNSNLIQKKSIDLPENKYLKHLLKRGNIFCHSTLFIKKEAIDAINGYDENLRYAQDCDLYIRLLEHAQLKIAKDYLVDHRINSYRNSKYREILSLTYSLFAVMRHIVENRSIKKYFYGLSRMVRYGIEVIRISKR